MFILLNQNKIKDKIRMDEQFKLSAQNKISFLLTPVTRLFIY